MHHESSQFIDPQLDDKKKTKRYLSKQLIQHIINLYDSVIQKIEHGIGLLWEEYFSKELFNIAKLRVEHELINDTNDLNDWFEKISANIKDKVTNLSANLLSHFDQIIRGEVDFLHYPVINKLSFTTQHQLQQKQGQKFDDPFSQNKLNQSLYETCTQSSRGNKKKPSQQRLQTVSSQSICSQDLSKQLTQEQNSFIDTENQYADLMVSQPQQNQLAKSELKCSNQSPRKLRKISQNESEYLQEQAQGGLYGVLLGLLEVFDI